MPESESRPSRAPRRGGDQRRLPLAVLAVTQLLCAVIAVISLNYLAAAHPRTWDLSRDRGFTLSPQTRRLLQSGLLRERSPRPRIIAAVRKSFPHYARLHALLGEYRRLSDGRLEVEFVDPIRNPDRTLEIADAYDHVFTEDIMIIDARRAGPPASGQDASPPDAHVRFLPVSRLLVHRSDARGRRRLIGFQDEDYLTSSLLSALEGQSRAFYFLADKSQIQDAGEDTPWSFLAETLRGQNVALTPLRLSDVDAIPADAQGVALVAPRYDLDPREEAILRDYWDRPRSALLVLLDPAHRPRRIHAFLREHGVTPRDDRILSVQDGRRRSNVRAVFTHGAQLNRINRDLSGMSTVFEGGTSSLGVREASDDLVTRGIFPIALLEVGEGFWGETRYAAEEVPVFNPREDFPPPLFLAAGVIKGNERIDRLAARSSRLVVLSNVAFLDRDNRHVEQLDFVRNAANWLIGREELIGIGPRPIRKYKLNLVPAQVEFVNRLNLVFLPAALLLAGLMVWNARRS